MNRDSLFLPATSEKYSEAELQVPRTLGRYEEPPRRAGSEVLAHAKEFVTVHGSDIKRIYINEIKILRHGNREETGRECTERSGVRARRDRKPESVNHGSYLVPKRRSSGLSGLGLVISNRPIVVIRRA